MAIEIISRKKYKACIVPHTSVVDLNKGLKEIYDKLEN